MIVTSLGSPILTVPASPVAGVVISISFVVPSNVTVSSSPEEASNVNTVALLETAAKLRLNEGNVTVFVFTSVM